MKNDRGEWFGGKKTKQNEIYEWKGEKGNIREERNEKYGEWSGD